MTAPLERAYVQIVADFTGFARDLEAGVQKAFAQAKPSLDRAAESIAAALREAARSGATSMDSISRSANTAAENLGDEFATNGEQAERSLHEVARAADTSMDAVVHDARRGATALSLVSGSARLAGPILLGLGTAAAAGLGALTTFGLQAAAAQEQTLIAFESLLGSAVKGQEVFGQLRDFAAATPFELPQITDVAKRFLTFSKTVGLTNDQLIPFLTTVGNIASVTGAGAFGMSRVALALGQIASKSKVSLEELNQISEALPGFSAITAIATAKGISTAEAMRQISAGTISAKDGVAALLEGMQSFPGAAAAMEKQSKTLLGLFSTFKDDVTNALIGGFAPVIPQLKQTLADITPVVKEAIAGLAPILGNILVALGPLAADLIRALNPILSPLIEGLRVGLEALRPALQPLGDALGRIFKAAAPILVVVGKLIGAVATALIPVIDALTPLIEGLVPVFAELGEALTPVLEELGQSLADVITQLVPVLLQTLQALIPLIPSALRLTVALLPLVELLAELVQTLLVDTRLLEVLTHWSNLTAAAIDFAAKAVAAFVGWLGNIDWEATGQAIGGAFAAAWNAVTSFFTGIGRWLGDLPNKVGAAFGKFRDTVAARITDVVTLIASLPGRLVGIVTGLGNQMFQAGRGIIQHLIDGLLSMAAKLGNTMSDLVRRGIRDFLPFSPAKIGPLSGGGDPIQAGAKIVDRLAAGIAAATSNLAAATGSSLTTVNVTPGPMNVSVSIDGNELRGVVSSVVDQRNRATYNTVRSRANSGERRWP